MLKRYTESKSRGDAPDLWMFLHGRHENKLNLGGHTTYGCVLVGGGVCIERWAYLGKSAVCSLSRGIPEFKGLRLMVRRLVSYGLSNAYVHVILDDKEVIEQVCLNSPASQLAAPHLKYLLDALGPLKLRIQMVHCTWASPEMEHAKELSLIPMRHYSPCAD